MQMLLPLNLVISLLLVGGGVIQNLKSAEKVSLVEPIAVSAEGEILEDAVIDLDTETVTVDGEIVPDAQIVTEQFVPMGPAASQVVIKQTGTNGGGYMGVNSAHPLENPNAFINLIEMISILLISAALCFTFGSAVKNKKQGIAIFMAMFLCLVVALGRIAATEQVGTSQLAQNGAINMSMAEQAGSNMEGKETRFGIAASSTWAAFTTAASNGSVNSMHDSYTPLAGMVTMLLMQLGEVIFGGVGCGLYNANGSIIEVDGKKYGCELLGQQYTDESHMWGRIMNINVSTYTDENGKALMYAVPSNISPASEEYAQLVAERVKKLRAADPDMDETAIPVDLVTCSGSGLDSHVSPAAAEYQVARIAKANDMTDDEVRKIIRKCTDGRFLGIFGEETVNVLEVNLMLDGILEG